MGCDNVQYKERSSLFTGKDLGKSSQYYRNSVVSGMGDKVTSKEMLVTKI